MNRALWIAALVCGALVVTAPATAEEATGQAPAAYYINPGQQLNSQLQFTVHIWGEVNKPGLYIVPSDTDLVKLMSYAGGPSKNASLHKVRLVRSYEGTDQVIELDVNDFVKDADPRIRAPLLPGDTVVVPGSRWYGFSRVVAVLAQVAIVATATNVIFFDNGTN